MTQDPKIEHSEPRHFIGMRRVVPVPEIGPVLGEMLPAAFGLIGTHGVTPAGPPSSFYFDFDDEAQTVDLLGGFFTTDLVEAPEGFEAHTLPASEVASVLHQGPYTEISQVHHRLHAFIYERGRSAATPCWETYLNDPTEVAPHELLTLVAYALEPAS